MFNLAFQMSCDLIWRLFCVRCWYSILGILLGGDTVNFAWYSLQPPQAINTYYYTGTAVSDEIFCPTKILSDEILSDQVLHRNSCVNVNHFSKYKQDSKNRGAASNLTLVERD